MSVDICQLLDFNDMDFSIFEKYWHLGHSTF